MATACCSCPNIFLSAKVFKNVFAREEAYMTQTTQTPKFSSAHFIGIGGAGMSGIALVLFQRGCKVTGSDLKNSRYVRDLEHAGIDVRIGHHYEIGRASCRERV